MDTETILTICTTILPVVVGIIVFLVTYFVRGKTITEAKDEAESAKKLTEEILDFYDPEKAYSNTSDDALDKISQHEYSYCLEKDEKDRIFEGLDATEIASLEEVIAGYEADMNVDYNLHTSNGDWRIYYGTPTKLESTTVDY